MNEFLCFVSPLVRQAARNLYQLELIRGTLFWTDCYRRRKFWHVQRMMARTPDETAAWLPALAFAVSREKHPYVLAELARWPLPEPLPPEALPWRDILIRNWKQCPVPTEEEKSIRLFALVRLDRRAERLPKWLAEAHRVMDMEPQNRSPRLAALAGWRPRPGDGPPHMGSTGVAQAWVRFWEASYKSPDMDGLIAATALLHLAEAGWLPSGPPTERLREEFRQRVQQWPMSTYQDAEILRMLLSSVPADASAPERRQQDIRKWLELTHENVDWEKREAIWEMLAAWQREGVLERSGRGRLPEPPLLLPDLSRTLEWEQDRDVLQALAGYVPGAAEVRAHPEAVRDIVARWEALGRNDDSQIRQASWVARWNLRRAGVMTARKQARFAADYVDAIRSERNEAVLLALDQITPPGTFPLAIWTRRLSDQDDRCRLVARLAIHGWLVDMAGGGQRRQMRQALRRAGQEGAGNRPVAPFVNLPPEVWPDFRRLREIETTLAAGHLPPSPDAGMENRSAPRAVPARLPEAHPADGPARHHRPNDRQDSRFGPPSPTPLPGGYPP